MYLFSALLTAAILSFLAGSFVSSYVGSSFIVTVGVFCLVFFPSLPIIFALSFIHREVKYTQDRADRRADRVEDKRNERKERMRVNHVISDEMPIIDQRSVNIQINN